jgi:hypothetical protein
LETIANLMLTAFANNCRNFVCEIITWIFKNPGTFGYAPFTQAMRDFFEKHLMANTFFSIDTKPSFHQDKFRQILFDTALKTNQIPLLKWMCGNKSNVPDTSLGESLCYFSDKFDLVCWDRYLALLAFNGDEATIKYIFEHCANYHDTIISFNKARSILIGALYGNHLDLADWLADKTGLPDSISMRGRTITCLLRCNHFDKVQSLILDSTYKAALEKLTINNAFSTVYDLYLPMPKVKLETFEFCVGLFGPPNEKYFYCSSYAQIFSIEVLKKYGQAYN